MPYNTTYISEQSRIPAPLFNKKFSHTRVKKQILIVDDEPSICALLSELLEDNGYQCTSVPDGTQAMQLIFSDHYQLVLLDISMPGMSGINILRSLKASGKKMPVIILSGSDADSLVAEAMHLGARDFILKPFDLETILTSIEVAQSARKER